MAVIMKSDRFIVIGIDPGSGNDRPAEISANVFDNLRGLAFIRHGADIEAIFMVGINRGLEFFEKVADSGMQFIEQGSLERIPEQLIIEMFLWRQEWLLPTPLSETRQWM